MGRKSGNIRSMNGYPVCSHVHAVLRPRTREKSTSALALGNFSRSIHAFRNLFNE
ncbi:GL22986 [Drosophila persimilis]|uniref:GL22986 n=1 Tax=Drosophila persimilis TaxID=7234 RepID=B4IRY6_DROPE|nr:GL22986 [Drosophila persimilis]